MNDVDLEIVGDKELLRAFRELDVKTQHKRLHQVLNDAGNIPKKAMRESIPIRRTKLRPPSHTTGSNKWHPPGTGKKSITKKRGRSKSTPTLFVGPRTKTGSYKNDAYYLRIWDLYSPGKRELTRAVERSVRPTEAYVFKSMRKIIQRAWDKHARR